ncbi:hypothetical protein G7Z17_g9606 [Cylindrodendrum hubeiense]|uniref:AAA+ ATPase domain-containing protein n=1 Tax=Cylindrodendrum hubeiense TaxID=595255 RepID=A0A9P5LC13_9HYPO|nr:hypothetical protein G7Z17_g9606 [Cylindrodendrum hubeiense]
MESTEATIVPADRRDDANPIGSTTATDDSARTPVETNHNSTEPDSKSTGAGRSDPTKRASKKSASKRHRHGKSKAAKQSSKKAADAVVSDNENDSESSDALDSSDSDSDSGDEGVEAKSNVSKKHIKVPKSKPKSTKKAKSKQQPGSNKKATKKQAKKSQKKKTKSAAVVSDADSSSDDESEDSSDDEKNDTNTVASEQNELKDEFQALKLQVTQLQQQLSQQNTPTTYAPSGFGYPYSFPLPQPSLPIQPPISAPIPPQMTPGRRRGRGAPPPRGNPLLQSRNALLGLNDVDNDTEDESKKSKTASGVDFKRVDWVWDNKIHNFTLQDTAESTSDSQYNDFIFHVRRTFDWEGKYRATVVDIKSKLLRECLQDVMGDVAGVSLVDETPKVDPNLLFLYLEDMRDHRKSLKHTKPAGDNKKERKKNQKRLDEKRKHLKVLLKYLDQDYAATKESLSPMLESGLITFDLLWALWKPNTMACMSTYGSTSDPRAFKVEMAQLHTSIMKGNFYYVDGKYFEYDGKKFGYGNISEDIPEFHGARKITSLPCYPLKYHQNEEQLRKDLIERGKKFVSLSGVHYKSYQGMAFLKRKKMIVKFNVGQSRVMVDPAIFRRINPNYSVSMVKPKDHDVISDSENSDSEEACCCESSDDSEGGEKVKFVTRVFKDSEGDIHMARMPKGDIPEEPEQDNLDLLPNRDGSGKGDKKNRDAEVDDGAETQEFTNEEYLIASPVVLGFAFSEKQWLEFTVSGIKEIKWNEEAWDSLVLEDGTKDLIKALVESRKYHAATTIDDVIQGKGKGLVTVLHGPPGTGKTLTAEGISELLKCPLYMASAGELGTDSRFLEAELQKILDICHAWGAILLLDEADVFLEKRDMHNIHRNALVSIFLRQLEYFQGILFLTTNRVETFDEAFQSRIHIALRYDNLDAKAKRTIFEMFLDRVKTLGKIEVKPLTEDDLVLLSKQDLNGREIKNVVGSAQDLAVNKGEALSMKHIKQVLNVHAKFGRDLKGGSGYEDAMRSYF